MRRIPFDARLPVATDLFVGQLLILNQLIVPFISNLYPPLFNVQLEHDDSFGFLVKVDRDAPALQLRKLPMAIGGVLKSLNKGVAISINLGLNRDDKLSSGTVYTHVQFVNFDLSNRGHVCTQVALQRVSGHAQESVYEPIVANSGQSGLFIRLAVSFDDMRCRVEHLDRFATGLGFDGGPTAPRIIQPSPSGVTSR
jgi:hypothetical protein